MKKVLSVILLTLIMLSLLVPVALAAADGSEPSEAKMKYFTMAVLASGLAIGVAAFGTGIAQGIGLGKACEGVARNPGASGKIMTNLIIGLAMIESLCIYALVVVLIIFFVDPFGLL